MGHQTEAACLLESGALYARRVLLRPSSGDPIFVGFKSAAFSLYFGDAPIYHFDLEGRWQRAFVDGTHYLKGLDTTVQAIDRVREGENLVLRRRTLGVAEAGDLDDRVRSAAQGVLEALGSRRLERVEPPSRARPLPPDELRASLEQVARWDAAAWCAHRERYLGTYGPLPLLPPDCLNAVVLQATLGHAGGSTFGLSAVAEHSVRSASEFEEHARTVAELLGRRTLQSRSIFLGGGDVLRRPSEEVLAYLETVARVFPIGAASRLEGIHAFLDDFSAPRPDRETWRIFRGLHLSRVSLGVESGDPEVRAMYRKAWANEDLVAIVADLKAAGIGVGVLVLAGAGGAEHAESHLAATADLINALELGPGDLVSLLDAEEVRDPHAGGPGFSPLTAERRAEQQAGLKQRLLPVRTLQGAKVAPYSLEKQGLG
ncbi:MAG: radical SAM protein [Planctomycetaceae bacterium]|nr:radical SAM protein [Planctomycetaceae bacterium]